jgi:hypothetical protein
VENKLREKLNELLDDIEIDWGILICGKKGDCIYSVMQSDETEADFVKQLHAKLWEGCPFLPDSKNLN